MTIDHIFFYLALGGYFVGALHYLLYVVKPTTHIGKTATAITLAGFVAHTVSHAFRLYEMGRPPLTSPYESLSFFAWAVILIYLIMEFRYRNRILGAFVVPLAILAASGAAALPSRMAEFVPQLQGLGLWSHVAMALFGNAAFALTFSAGLVYLIQERRLKSRQFGGLNFRMPSLEVLDDIGFKSILFGFPLLTLALISGSLWAEHARGSFLTWRPWEIWSAVSWTIYGGLLYARVSVGWRGRKAALLAILGFCLVLVTFIGVKVLGSARVM
jgi:cytochrome c-type biogenesis protein CcsB